MMAFSTSTIAALMLTLQGLEAALVLTQEKTLSVNGGDNVKISCTETDSSSDYTLSWYQQKSGALPKYLLYTTGSSASGVPSRFTYSGTGGDKTEYLLINGIQDEDEATYYCACVGCSANHNTGFGGGTEVILAGSPSPPSLELMVPTQPPVPGLGGPTLVCLAKGFHPAGATLSWSEDGASVRGEEVQAGVAQRQPDGSYTLSSVLLLPSTRWRSGHTFTCHVSHSALSSPLSKSVSSQQCSL
ncbi:immunoglobulin kappa light chain-like [Gadus macrocephalus]|uniref:immunoglobulin kappa light chain-like n=1 Tax=Gadus macrocephalus TaxID=80720 RepID=UPI0028CB347E|nr:immunoglobulin kappa light chain-like [Gadus macrocephalus]